MGRVDALSDRQLSVATDAFFLDALIVVAVILPSTSTHWWDPSIALGPGLQEQLTTRHGWQGPCVAIESQRWVTAHADAHTWEVVT